MLMTWEPGNTGTPAILNNWELGNTGTPTIFSINLETWEEAKWDTSHFEYLGTWKYGNTNHFEYLGTRKYWNRQYLYMDLMVHT